MSFVQTQLPVTRSLAEQLALSTGTTSVPKVSERKAEHRHRSLCRNILGSHLLIRQARRKIVDLIHQPAYTMSDSADLINVALEQFNKNDIQLPVVSTQNALPIMSVDVFIRPVSADYQIPENITAGGS